MYWSKSTIWMFQSLVIVMQHNQRFSLNYCDLMSHMYTESCAYDLWTLTPSADGRNAGMSSDDVFSGRPVMTRVSCGLTPSTVVSNNIQCACVNPGPGFFWKWCGQISAKEDNRER